jgi:hypothetical protein
MRPTKLLLGIIVLTALAVVATRCNNGKNDDKTTNDSVIHSVPLPVVVKGFHFPEDSNTVYHWLSPYDSASVYSHAWGIWAGLTAQSGEVFQGDSLLVYQTWLGIGEIQQLVMNEQSAKKSGNAKTGLTPLTLPRQFTNTAFKQTALKQGIIDTSAGENFGSNFWVAVAYDPAAVSHVITNSLLKQSVLDSYKKKDAIGYIPPFPADAITTKPVYYVGHRGDSLIRIPVWPGPPASAKAYSPADWNTYVYADVKNRQPAGKKLVPVKGSHPSPAQMNAATCNLNDFIHLKIDGVMAEYLNAQDSTVQGDVAAAGDIALLVAMHVTSKEISNWTWQSYYWAPDPVNPFSPSSMLAASLRPSVLSRAAAHYAVTVAYTEVLPNQPITGGSDKGATAMIGYNPYLEAGFDPSVFTGYPNTFNRSFQFGVQTNCMSCHALATPQSLDKDSNDVYSTDQYVDMNNPFFKNKVQLDFAWSIQAAIIPDSSLKKKK